VRAYELLAQPVGVVVARALVQARELVVVREHVQRGHAAAVVRNVDDALVVALVEGDAAVRG